jgi:hypothetical protein
VAAAAIFIAVGIPLLIAFGLPGFAAGVAAQAVAALVMRVYYLRQLFPGFRFLGHAARAFAPTVPGAAVVLAVRALEPAGRTLAVALGELAAYVLVTLVATLYLESGLLREALEQLGPPPQATAV